MTKRILIIDDDPNILRFFKKILIKETYVVHTCSNLKTAMEQINLHRFDLIIADLNLQQDNGLNLLKYLKTLPYHISFIVITGYGSVESAVKAVKSGAVEYVMKPFSKNYILNTINNILKNREKNEQGGVFKEIIGKSQAIQNLFNIITKVAPSSATILIQGESGTGKELIANAIHNHSPRHDASFIAINCAAFSESLLENELFGHVKGAFTGATDYKPGLFEIANNGTLLLDEIGDMPLALQTKLLRVLQEKEFKPLGSNTYTKTNFRIVASTNVDLKQAMKEKKFREDLYYRLAVIEIHVPPLRKRTSDIPLLVDHFLKKHCHENGYDAKKITDKAIEELQQHKWVGNVRELENTIERAVTLSNSNVITSDLLWMPDSYNELPKNFAEEILGDTSSIHVKSLKELLNIITKKAILYALNKTGGNRSRAAELLKMGRASFYNKINELDIE